MTRVLIVHNDRAAADRVAASVREAGYETEVCLGPLDRACPVEEGLPCPLADRADVLVYDAGVAGDPAAMHNLTAHLRDVYADLPVVLTSADQSLTWVEQEGPERVLPVAVDAGPGALRDAIDTVLSEQGMAV